MSRSPVRLVALVSTYREGRLARSAIESAAPFVDQVIVLEGPFGDAPTGGEPTDLLKLPSNVLVLHGGPYEDDAQKRTIHARAVADRHLKSKDTRPLWGLLLDGDEVLVNGQWLRDWTERARPDADRMLSMRIQEWDGTTIRTFCRLMRLDLLDHYVMGTCQFVFVDNPVIRVVPFHVEVSDTLPADELAYHREQLQSEGCNPPWRAPLQGEPHIFHRPFLRPDGRFDERGHRGELEWAERVSKEVGVA